jgi:hypothetical protein
MHRLLADLAHKRHDKVRHRRVEPHQVRADLEARQDGVGTKRVNVEKVPQLTGERHAVNVVVPDVERRQRLGTRHAGPQRAVAHGFIVDARGLVRRTDAAVGS